MRSEVPDEAARCTCNAKRKVAEPVCNFNLDKGLCYLPMQYLWTFVLVSGVLRESKHPVMPWMTFVRKQKVQRTIAGNFMTCSFAASVPEVLTCKRN